MKHTLYNRIWKIVFAGSLLASAGNAQEQKFSRIVIENQGQVIITQGDRCAVTATPATGETPFEIRKDVLYVISRKDKVQINATIMNLEGIEIRGKGKVTAPATIQVQDLDISISGYGSILLPLEADRVHTRISGKGDIELTGSADVLDASISGAGKVQAAGFATRETHVDISGAGKVESDASELLDIRISGIGSVKYKSSPVQLKRHVSGIGKIGPLNGEDHADGTGSDTTTVRVGGREILIIGDDDDGERVEVKAEDKDEHRTVVRYSRGGRTQAHWAGFELGFNQYFTNDFNSDLPDGYEFLELNNWKSIAVNLNLFDWKIPVFDHHFAFVSGLGVTWNNWRFQGDRTLVPNMTTLTANFDSVDYKKNKLTASYVTLPLLFEFNSSAQEHKSFHASAGVIMGYRIGSHTKQKLKENGKTQKIKTYDDFNLNPYRYDATFRIGYRGYTVFASYGLAYLFKKNQGPELHPFTFGITLVDW